MPTRRKANGKIVGLVASEWTFAPWLERSGAGGGLANDGRIGERPVLPGPGAASVFAALLLPVSLAFH